jgi:hypothetical protein
MGRSGSRAQERSRGSEKRAAPESKLDFEGFFSLRQPSSLIGSKRIYQVSLTFIQQVRVAARNPLTTADPIPLSHHAL